MTDERSKSLDLLWYLTARGTCGALSILPLPVAARIGEGLGRVVYKRDARHRRIGMTNLRFAFPEESDEWRADVLERSYAQIGAHVAEVSRLDRIPRKSIRRRVSYQEGLGVEHYRRAHEEGRGVLFVTAHIGSWEMLSLAHAALEHPLSFIVRPLENAYLDRWLTRIRSQFGNRVIPKQGSLREILRVLRRGEDVGLLIDQNVQEKDGVYVQFFGRTACTTASAALLAMKTGAPVIPGFIVPAGLRGHYRIRFYPPLHAEMTGCRAEDIVHNTTRFNSFIEQVIREYPHCWLWGHRRFRTQPDGRDPYET
ncbi:MAG: lysophospholipid acyltransferase family protein [Acidobacteriota bacterium]